MQFPETPNELKTTSMQDSPEAEAPPSPLKRLGIVLFGVFFFFVFLVLKLPEARIQNLILAHVKILAQQQGYLFSAEKAKVGILFGPTLKLYNIELRPLDDDKLVVKLPYLKISPQLLSMLGKTRKVSLSAELPKGSISGSIGASVSSIYIDVDLDSFRLDTTEAGNPALLLKKAAPLDLAGTIDGTLRLDLDQATPQKSEGKIALKIEKLALPPQSFMGFNLPKIGIGRSKIDILINQGQVAIREFEVGSDAKTDDLVAKLTGEGIIDARPEMSKLNVKAVFEVSKSLSQSFPLLDALLGPAKTADGKYAYRLSGPLSTLEAQPAK